METSEMEIEVEQIARSSDYVELTGYLEEESSEPEKFNMHWWLAHLVFARLRHRIKQRMRTIKNAAEKMAFYRTLRQRLPAFARALVIL